MPENQLLEQLPAFQDLRRNHALEHAAIHVLSKRHPQYRFIGRSDFRGFYMLSTLPLEYLVDGLEHALKRLQSGEKHLAVHPNCGTNLLTGAFLAALSGFLVFNAPRRSKRLVDQLDILPLAIVGAMLSLVVAQPLGNSIQKNVTTQTDLNNSSIISVSARPSGKYFLYRVLTRHS
ncbi:MAG: hypothetical protein JXA25_07950 [Anaerolineales bacterium]|nr:hypothetical protein [Anaerolineales bacterium]